MSRNPKKEKYCEGLNILLLKLNFLFHLISLIYIMHLQSWTVVLKSFTLTILIQTLVLNGDSVSEAAKITSFPGQPRVHFQQYSGYIAVSTNPKRELFYYFVEAETNPASKPLVLWLNGGEFFCS